MTTLFPGNFAGVAQLPQVAGEPLDACVAELERAVTELGFVGCNLNPDPAGGFWSSPPLTDEYWFPLYEKMTELDVPAMIHVSTSCNPAAHTLGAHYLNADTTAFMQLVQGRLFERFPACASSSRTAAARCPTTGAASRASRPGRSSRRSRRT